MPVVRPYQHAQLFCECQLVALWNAAHFFGIPRPVMGSEEYKKACVEAACVDGACLNLAPERKRLGLVTVKGKRDLAWVREHLPVHVAVFHPSRGYHSVLIIAVRGGKVCMANYAQGSAFWMRWKTLCEKRMPARNRAAQIFSYQKKKGRLV